MSAELDAVTGAFSYTGKYITRQLLACGKQVRTLTRHPHRPNPFGSPESGSQVSVAPLDFDRPEDLVDTLRGVTTFYNTYWVRFPHGDITFDRAVQNTRVLLRAARQAGVRRFVHISVANASEGSPLPYFRGKGALERAVRESGLSYTILRPTVLFGPEDILINNIAWFLRRFPVFGVPGDGRYKIQPIYVEDLAEFAAEAGEKKENETHDAAGPEIFTFDELVRLIAARIGSNAMIVHLHPQVALLFCRLVGLCVRDVVLTREEIEGLMANLLVTGGPPTGRRRFSHWLEENAAQVGRNYSSELARHYR